MSSQSKYFHEIDSLRALAVIVVIINHINKAWLPGGFLGVDVFFVISGFVVTASLMQNKSNDVSTFFFGFYRKRLKRLYPALLACLFITFICTLCLYANPEQVLKTGFWSIWGVGNIQLIKAAQDYFSISAEANPFTHMWSLGVEEQFYLVYPLIFYFFVKKKNSGILPALSILCLSSFAIFIHFKFTNEGNAFYLMPSRFWQLSCGSLLFLSSATSIFRKFNKHLVAIPLAVLVFCFFASKSFSINYTFLATICTILILALIKETEARSYFLLKPILTVGLSSYSLYLYHWPVLVLMKQTVGILNYNLLIAIILICTLSLISYEFVEKKLRSLIWNKINYAVFYFILGLLVLIYKKPEVASKKLFLGNPIEQYSLWDELPRSINKNCFLTSTKPNPFKNDKLFKQTFIEKCKIHTTTSEKSIYSFGSSYLEEKLPVLLKFAQDNHYNLYTYIASGTPLYPFNTKISTHQDKTSFFWHAFFETLSPNLKNGDLIVVSSALNVFLTNEAGFTNDLGERISKDQAFTIYIESLEKLTKRFKNQGVKLIYIGGSYPYLKKTIIPVNCYQPWSKLNNACSWNSAMDFKKSNQLLKLENVLKNNPKLNYVSIYEEIYSAHKELKDPFKVYHNHSHITKMANEYLYPKVITGFK
jgi:peptidoglycan/LPS O-acetylase OafA/YrhL